MVKARALTVIPVSALLVAVAGSPGRAEPAPQVAPTAIAAPSWTPCPSEEHPDKVCASYPVPRDYSDPTGTQWRIALAKVPATGTPDRFIGTLFWDAGGPGGPSTQLADHFADRLSPAVRERFDFVAFDPRGIGSSRPALRDCGQPWPVRPRRSATPDWGVVRSQSAALLNRANRNCLRRNSRVAGWMGTNAVVRDLDTLRRAVGDDALNFWATSYGTRIGYVYALRYPHSVRALVMDGNIDPSRGYPTLPAVGGTSQDLALRFMRRHARRDYRAVMRLAADLTDEPIPLSRGNLFDRWDWLDIVGDWLPFPDSWSSIRPTAASVSAARGGGPQARAVRRQLRDAVARPNSNEGAGFSVVNCLDYADHLSAAQQTAIIRSTAIGYPVFGGSLSTMYGIGCSGLNGLRPDPIPLVTTATQRSRLARVPAVFSNATHDGSTPIAWARSMTRAFGGRPLIRYRSTEHVIWGAVDSTCVNGPIDRFMLRGREPGRGRVCPFVPPR